MADEFSQGDQAEMKIKTVQGLIRSRGLDLAYWEAENASTRKGTSAGGWVRLAVVQGTWIIAIRRVNGKHRYQFGCDCSDWILEHRRDGKLCRHQIQFLKGARFMRLYKAGRKFLEVL